MVQERMSCDVHTPKLVLPTPYILAGLMVWGTPGCPLFWSPQQSPSPQGSDRDCYWGQMADNAPVVVSSSLQRRPDTVTSSINLMKRCELCVSVHLWGSRVKRRASANILAGSSCSVWDVFLLTHLLSLGQHVQQPVAQRGVEPQLVQFENELLANNCV